ncbi:DUF898 domain-containing protein [Stratiformator vulcanicus]|uniref:Uncharacterized protein n=1 Tax=Stratiformator vulcanicus TaxID=2527980 RepID=A0A517R6G5_9PLAN|nr:DUF898 domain-containing protein [Stratiformator vulcanicus]QDT39494.1 hypothetical protein Pan189_39020 [Stratiformator vulcanicus]
MNFKTWKIIVTIGYGAIAVAMLFGIGASLRNAAIVPNPTWKVGYLFFALICVYGIVLAFRTAKRTRQLLDMKEEERKSDPRRKSDPKPDRKQKPESKSKPQPDSKADPKPKS